MTYLELANRILLMSDEQKGCDIAIHDGRTDEVLSGVKFISEWKGDSRTQFVESVLDYDHPFFTI